MKCFGMFYITHMQKAGEDALKSEQAGASASSSFMKRLWC
jgi:hypothetical protein